MLEIILLVIVAFFLLGLLSRSIHVALIALVAFFAVKLVVALLSLVGFVVIWAFYAAVFLAGAAVGVIGLYRAARWMAEERERKIYFFVCLLAVPVAVMVIAFALGGLTGAGFSSTETVVTKKTAWFFFTEDVVTYRTLPTVWKKWFDISWKITPYFLGAIAIEWFVRTTARKSRNA